MSGGVDKTDLKVTRRELNNFYPQQVERERKTNIRIYYHLLCATLILWHHVHLPLIRPQYY